MTDFHGPMEPNEDFEIQWWDQEEVDRGLCVIRPRDCPLGPENQWEKSGLELDWFLEVMTPECQLCRQQGRTMPYPCGMSWRSTFHASYLWEPGGGYPDIFKGHTFMGYTCDKCGARSPTEQERAMAWIKEHAPGCRRIER